MKNIEKEWDRAEEELNKKKKRRQKYRHAIQYRK